MSGLVFSSGWNIDDGYKAITATDATFRESADAQMTPPGKEQPTNLAGLRGRGAKMLFYHGVSDAIFSAEDTVAFLRRLDSALGGRSQDFARYFPVPGMAHCSGGPATDLDGLESAAEGLVEGPLHQPLEPPLEPLESHAESVPSHL